MLPTSHICIVSLRYSSPHLPAEDMFQDPQWMVCGTAGSTEPYIYYVSSYIYIPVVEFLTLAQ